MAQASECLPCPFALPWKQIYIDCFIPYSLVAHQLWALSTSSYSLCCVISCRFDLFSFFSLVFLFVFSVSLFSIWNLFYPLYGSIDPLSYRPPASWCPLLSVTQTIIACGHFWLFQCWWQFSQLMPCSRLVYHQEHPGGSPAFCFHQMIDSEAETEGQKAAKLAH